MYSFPRLNVTQLKVIYSVFKGGFLDESSPVTASLNSAEGLSRGSRRFVSYSLCMKGREEEEEEDGEV